MKAKKTVMYVCDSCRSYHVTEAKAEACCRCKCGNPIRKNGHGGNWKEDKCEICWFRWLVREQRAQVKRHAVQLKTAKEDLAACEEQYAILRRRQAQQ